MAASQKQVNQAKKMADQGKSAAQIARKTGVSSSRAGNLASSRGPMQSSGSQYTDGVTYQLNDQGTAPVSFSQGGGGGGTQSAAPFPYQDGVTYQLNDAGTGPVGFYQDGNLVPMGSGGPAASRRTLSDARGLGESLRIAGANGNLSKREMLRISKETGKGTDRIVRRLDEVNTKRTGKNKAPIGLGSGAFNSLLNMPTSRTLFGKTMSELGLGDKYANYGKGGIGQAVMQAKGTSDYYGNSVKGTGKIPKGMQVFGSYNGAPQIQIRPKNNVNAGYYGPGSGAGGGAGGGGGNGANGQGVFGEEELAQTQTTPMTPEEMAAASTVDSTENGLGSMAGGGLGSAGAAGLRRPKSRLKQLGISGRGTSLFGRGLQYGNVHNK